MATYEKFEIVAIVIFVLSVYFIKDIFPSNIAVGNLLLNASSMLLAQSLIRDVWFIFNARSTKQLVPKKIAQCMCLESTVGISGVLIGILLIGVKIDWLIVMTWWTWMILVGIILSIGFYIKDFVFEWRPWRVYRDKNHMNIIFAWKK